MRSEIEFVAGIDGGGTKTTVICRNLQGQTLAEQKFGPFNLNSIGEEKFTALMAQICTFLQSIGSCLALCIGAAGVSNLQMKNLIRHAMENAGITNWQLVGDHEIALCGALEGGAGISLVAGTGSICYGKNSEGEVVRAGGWGHLIGDEGSGYAIGRDALRAIARHWDGCGEETSLTRAVAEQLQIINRQKMIAYIYGNDKSSVAVVSRIVEREAALGDQVANLILKENADQLSELVAAVAKRLDMKAGEVALLGGLLENHTVFRKFLIKAVEDRCPGFACVAPRQTAAVGAVMMAVKSLVK